MNFKLFFIIAFCATFLPSCEETNSELLDKGYSLSRQKKYDKAIEVYTEVLGRNDKLQLAYYNRGFAYMATKQYRKALSDFNKVMLLNTVGDLIITYNEDSPFMDEQSRTQVPYYDALYQRAQVKYFMDSLSSSFRDFERLVNNNYEEKSNCILWLGTICIRRAQPDKGCEYFHRAKQVAMSDDDITDAEEMISSYCEKTNNNR